VLLLAAGCTAQPPPGPGPFEVAARNDLRASAAVRAPDREHASVEEARVDAPVIADPFPDREHVTFAELVDALEVVAQQLEQEPAVVRDYEAFLAAHDLTDTPALFRDYVRVKLAFEATRDGGWWQLRWKITNQKPSSDRIWSQWADVHAPRRESAAPDPRGARALLRHAGAHARGAAAIRAAGSTQRPVREARRIVITSRSSPCGTRWRRCAR
jgi:hypothetical protein